MYIREAAGHLLWNSIDLLTQRCQKSKKIRTADLAEAVVRVKAAIAQMEPDEKIDVGLGRELRKAIADARGVLAEQGSAVWWRKAKSLSMLDNIIRTRSVKGGSRHRVEVSTTSRNSEKSEETVKLMRRQAPGMYAARYRQVWGG
ncbi:hypothetical protein DB771_04975 [Burkholderia sp. AU29985]|nr:hypothetical protein AK34_3324 [Burkholderia dolosa AU0158]AKE04902.1 hypothetical protein XM57_19390 [Burkholderia cepacia]AYZ94797.1 hypothetical protein EGY28_06920 [Burkholderia dolosa]ETP63814.1 hypothetical protein BDSB_23090 [Burkholderia dolosa PC543]PRE44273.1 hypothetical protein C6P87_23620 [Burkholderia sp. AU12872]PUA77995.1 hypothetical protein DB771_04975 [Burkholderia sp. AU29985]